MLRNYQIKGLNELELNFLKGIKRQILWLQTGAGKSLVFSHMAQNYVQKGFKIVVIVKRKELVRQASLNFARLGIAHSVFMACDPGIFPVHVCSVDTIASREIFPFSQEKKVLAIIDECHDAKRSHKAYSRIFQEYANCRIVGFTATPFGDNSFFEEIVSPIEGFQLRNEGYLVPDITYIPSTIDVTKVQLKNGDFATGPLAQAASHKEIVGDMVASWKKWGQERPTLLFAVNIKHAQILKERFLEAGIAAREMTSKNERIVNQQALLDFREGKLKILINVNILTTGVDIPHCGCIQIARPTMSLILFLQMIGRGLRISPGKSDCIILDHSGNTLRHGLPYDVREASINGPYKAKESFRIKTCARCFRVFAPARLCPYCGYVPIHQERERNLTHKEGTLIKVEGSENLKKQITFLKKYSLLKKRKTFIPNFAEQEIVQIFGKDYCKEMQSLGIIKIPQVLLL